MFTVVGKLKDVYFYLDDVIVKGSDTRESATLLQLYCSFIKAWWIYNIKVNLQKYTFFASSVEYLGHVIDSLGIKPMPTKADANIKYPVLFNVNKLKFFPGLIDFYGKYIPNLSTLLSPLYNLLRQDTLCLDMRLSEIFWIE